MIVICKACKWQGPNHKFQDHAAECLRGAPAPDPRESFDDWSVRVQEWRNGRGDVRGKPTV